MRHDPLLCRSLSPRHHLAIVEDDLVILDLAADSYACVPSVASRLDLAKGGRMLISADLALLDALAASGVVVDGPPATTGARPWPGPPRRSLFPDRPRPMRSRHVPLAARALTDSVRRYRGASLGVLSDWAIRHRPDRSEPLTTPDLALESCVADFHAWAAFAPTSGKCLLRSFMLLGQLRRAGHDALWVFGVSTWPFAAHCWLQHGDAVLDDTCERVERFQPILVV